MGISHATGQCATFLERHCIEPAKKSVESKEQCFALVRHGDRLDHANPEQWFRSAEGKKYPFDCPLTRTGMERATSVGHVLRQAQSKFRLIVTSPYLRCVQTAICICKALDNQPCIALDDDIGEVYGPATMGDWLVPPPSRPAEDLVALIEEAGIKLVPGPHSGKFGTKPPWGENIADARVRMLAASENYTRRSARIGKNFILVSHGDCFASTLAQMLRSRIGGTPLDVLEGIDYCAYFVARRECRNGEPASLCDERAMWRTSFGNCTVGCGRYYPGRLPQGPYEARPIVEEQWDSIRLNKLQAKTKSVTTGLLATAIEVTEGSEVRFLDLLPKFGLQRIKSVEDLITIHEEEEKERKK